MSGSNELVLSRIESGVGQVTLNRPEAMNTFNLRMAQRFNEVVGAFAGAGAVRVVVIRGAGRAFSAGGDVKEMLGDVREGSDRAAYFREPLAAFGEMVATVRSCPKPVVAAVHGAVAGVAFNLVLACDLVLAEERTRFTQAFIRIGLSPDGGGTWFLPRAVGHRRACELTMLPTEIDARQALTWGLVNWVVPEGEFEGRLAGLTEKLATGPAAAIRRTKALLTETYDRPLPEQMEAERLAQIENADHADFEEGLASFVEKRRPEFQPGA